MPPDADAPSLLQRLPHYRARDGALYFLASARPLATLTGDDLRTWEALETETSLEDVRARVGAGADAAVARLLELRVLDEFRTLPAGRRKVVVIEPHSDDAALSVGGTMWQRRNQVEFTLVTVASRSNFTSYFLTERDFFEVDEVTRIRNQEGAAFMRQLGGRHLALGENEATLRYRDGDWPLDFYRSHRVSVSAFNNRHALESDLERWRAAIRPVLARLDGAELWLPLGVGNHSDHELARNACLSLLIAEPELARGSAVRFYSDVPYDARHSAHLGRILEQLKKAGGVLVHEAVRVEEAYPRKLELLSLYASQFKVPAIARDVDESSQAGVGSSERCEHFYRLEQRPARLSARQMTLEAPQVEEIVPRVRRWIERYREAPLIRILMVLPPGRWRDDLQRLSAAFPKTRFEVHAAPSSTAEAGAVASPVVEVRHVPAGAMGWIRTALRLALSRPAPTLFLCGDRAREARLLARLWPFSDTIIARAMDPFVLALEQVCDTSGVDGQPAGPNGKVRGVR